MNTKNFGIKKIMEISVDSPRKKSKFTKNKFVKSIRIFCFVQKSLRHTHTHTQNKQTKLKRNLNKGEWNFFHISIIVLANQGP